jgi:parallel beta-helix repeat protein
MQPAKAEVIVVPVQYSTIQEAINAATSGDTIQVLNGTYYESVNINKSLILVGESPMGTIIEGHVDIFLDNVEFRGFTIRGGTGGVLGVGLFMWNSDDCTIRNNIITSCIHAWGYGMWISHSNSNTISENLIIQNSGSGIFIDEGSSYNKIVNNTISYNSLFGICVYDSGGAPCIGNVIISNNMDLNAWGCIEAASCSEGTEIIGNKIANSKYGIDFFSCHIHGSYHCEATITDNVIANCKYGVSITSAYSNNIIDNTVMNCTYGISIHYLTENNTVYHNNFINNVQQVNQTGTNTVWDGGYPSGGNYWSDYNGTDSDGDGIGDTPYVIDEYNRDNYPLMYPQPFIMGDVNCDAEVDIYDVTAVCIAYDSQPGDPNWYPPADIAEPYGIIDIYDVTAVCISYGKKWPN